MFYRWILNVATSILDTVQLAAEKALYFALERQDARASAAAFADHFVKLFYFPNSYLVVFRQSSQITNLIYTELSALIELHLPMAAEQSIHFQTSHHLKHELADFWESLVASVPAYSDFLSSIHNIQGRHEKIITDLCGIITENFDLVLRDHLSKTVLLDPYHTSCIIAPPQPLSQETFNAIVGESGYILYGGHLIYVRNSSKSHLDEMMMKLEADYDRFYRERPDLNTYPWPLVLYSQEDFVRTEGPATRDTMRGGLDNIKIPKSKYFIGNVPAADAFETMTQRLSEKYLGITTSVHYRTALGEAFGDRKSGRMTTFIIRDYGIEVDGRRADKQYILIYAQTIANNVPTHLFEESKPGWYGPVTLPHSLATAMFNICRPHFRKDVNVVLDPFAGGGTTFLESLRDMKTSFIGGDLNPLTKQITSDNLHFFALPAQHVDGVHDGKIKFKNDLESIKRVVEHLIARQPDGKSELTAMNKQAGIPSTVPNDASAPPEIASWAYRQVKGFIRSVHVVDGQVEQNLRTIREFEFPQSFVEKIAGADRFFTRIIFYLFWRGAVTNASDVFYDRADLQVFIEKELTLFLDRLEHLIRIRGVRADSDKVLLRERLLTQAGLFSDEVVIPASTYKLAEDGGTRWNVKSPTNALVLLKENSGKVDLIITDPPYGFNTDVSGSMGASGEDEAASLVDLYQKWLKRAIEALDDGGQLIFCLPDSSHNGQRIPAFVKKDWVTRQFMKAADELDGVSLISRPRYLPSHRALFAKPYYWRSERALTRAVLHFVVSKQSVDTGVRSTEVSKDK